MEISYGNNAAGFSGYNSSAGLSNNYQNHVNANHQFPAYYPVSNIGVIPRKSAHYDDRINTITDSDNPIIYVKDYEYEDKYKGVFGKLFQHKNGQTHQSPKLFNKKSFKNVLVGMLMWHLISGLGNKYTIYNYYNQPKITTNNEYYLATESLLPCDMHSTILCGPQIQPICTKDETIFCVADPSQVFTCKQDTKTCVNTTVFCLYENDPLCKDYPNQQEATVTVPCLGNITLETDLKNVKYNLEMTTNVEDVATRKSEYKYCITLMAKADPKYTVLQDDSGKKRPQ